ncbi:FAD-dependent oxidoreductase [Pseudomonas sp. B11D7D]|nr:FAD-dependent oxidoreductase [Pseudomonas sp. B11D7D]
MSDRFDLLLAGAGHAHLGVLRLWMGGQRPSGRIGLISPGPYAWYSGMLPGLLAGRYCAEQCRIPLQSLCCEVDVELLQGEVRELDPQVRQFTLDDGRQCTADWLSLNLGSLPKVPVGSGATLEALPVKPFEAFLAGWQRWKQSPQSLAILGGGAAGVELALALAPQIPELTLLSGGALLAGHPAALRKRALRHLADARVRVEEGVAVDSIHGDALVAGNRLVWRGTRVILATGASALPWLTQSGLACDERGFVRVGKTLQSLSHSHVFAAGDCASLEATPRNGVYAVRQGPALAVNLSAALSDQPMRPFQPQRRSLALLADGQGGALLSWAGITAEGDWLGRWKDRLDRRFIERHHGTH